MFASSRAGIVRQDARTRLGPVQESGSRPDRAIDAAQHPPPVARVEVLLAPVRVCYASPAARGEVSRRDEVIE
jgi:hypothetical protein